jgi:hypothetical protein
MSVANWTGVTAAANFSPEIWETETGDASQANCCLSALVDTQYESKMKNGDVIHITDKSNPAVRIKSEETAATASNITETMQTITINRHAYVFFGVEDILDIQAQTDVRAHYTDAAGYSLVAFLEGDATSGLASLPSSFSQAYGSLGSDATEDNFIDAMTALKTADTGSKDWFIYGSPNGLKGVHKIDRFRNADYAGGPRAQKMLEQAEIGMIFGAKVYESTLADNNPSASGQSYVWMCHKRGVALIRQRQPTVHTQYVIDNIGWAVLVDEIYQFAERLIAPKNLGGSTSDDRFNVAIAAG